MKRGKIVRNNSRSNVIRNIILIISIIFLIFLAFMIFRGITGEVISGFVAKENSRIFPADNIYTTIGDNCTSRESKDFAVGRVNTSEGLKEESAVMYFNLSKVGNQQIESAEFCIAKVNGNKFGFEFFISGENDLECPRALEDFDTRRTTRIAGREINSFVRSKYYCFNVTNYLKQKVSNPEKDIYLGVSGKNLTNSKQTFNYFHGVSLNNKLEPYLKLTLKKCIPDWRCDTWSSCINDRQERECMDIHNCGANVGKPEQQKNCGGNDGCGNCPSGSACDYAKGACFDITPIGENEKVRLLNIKPASQVKKNQVVDGVQRTKSAAIYVGTAKTIYEYDVDFNGFYDIKNFEVSVRYSNIYNYPAQTCDDTTFRLQFYSSENNMECSSDILKCKSNIYKGSTFTCYNLKDAGSGAISIKNIKHIDRMKLETIGTVQNGEIMYINYYKLYGKKSAN